MVVRYCPVCGKAMIPRKELRRPGGGFGPKVSLVVWRCRQCGLGSYIEPPDLALPVEHQDFDPKYACATCVDCGAPVKRGAKRCRRCAALERWRHRDKPQAKKLVCVDCGKPVSAAAHERCAACERVRRKKLAAERPRCPECGRVMDSRSQRCKECEKKAREVAKSYCIDCGAEITKGSKRCQSCANLEIRARRKGA